MQLRRVILFVVLLALPALGLSRSERRVLGHAMARAAPLVAPAPIAGQWIWTRADAQSFESVVSERPSLVPAIRIASIENRSSKLVITRGLSPAVGAKSVALVVRIEDSVHARWDSGPNAMADELGPLFTRVLEEAHQTGVAVSELQIDYDAPVRRLAPYARVIARLADRELVGVPLWVTSIPAHLDDPDYGVRLAGHVSGHILQLFDTGLRCTPAEISRIRAALARQPLAYRLGFAAFERPSNLNAAWLRSASELQQSRAFSGVWLFPATFDPRPALALLERGEK
jgi:hypothetical protein